MINPELDIEQLHRQFAQDNRLRIKNILRTEQAESLHSLCKTETPFNTNFFVDGQFHSKSEQQMSELGAAQRQRMGQAINQDAARGVGFLYQAYMYDRQQPKTVQGPLQLLHECFQYLNSEACLEKIRRLTGDNSLRGAECQFTRFLPGHYITRHKDVTPSGKRRFAYVINLSKDWHPDWGGLLQFFESNGTPRDAWTPEFNVMSIFAIEHIHSVTFVTPFAQQPRLSLTGWFLA